MEPRLNFVHICENAFTSSDGKLNVIGIFDQINALNFPALHPRLMIVTSVAGNIGKYIENIEIVSPKGEIIARAGNPIEIFKDGGSTNFIADFIGIVFPEDGVYKIRVKINETVVDNNGFIMIKKNG
ncbi:MAG: hypothetical protein WC678_04580 [Parcubacteria group bacterium]|jgi:hypothetical protein